MAHLTVDLNDLHDVHLALRVLNSRATELEVEADADRERAKLATLDPETFAALRTHLTSAGPSQGKTEDEMEAEYLAESTFLS